MIVGDQQVVGGCIAQKRPPASNRENSGILVLVRSRGPSRRLADPKRSCNVRHPKAAQRLSAIHHETEQNVHAVGRIPGSHLSARPGMTRSSGPGGFC
jgi:hypothetical protein